MISDLRDGNDFATEIGAPLIQCDVNDEASVEHLVMKNTNGITDIIINIKGVIFGVQTMNASSTCRPYLAPYISSKWTVIGTTGTAAVELDMAVCPTSPNTPMPAAAAHEAKGCAVEAHCLARKDYGNGPLPRTN